MKKVIKQLWEWFICAVKWHRLSFVEFDGARFLLKCKLCDKKVEQWMKY
jgi:hypothetical protein